MHIGVDATCWLNPRGYGRHARSLLSALIRMDSRNRYTMVTDSPEAVAQLPAAAQVRLVDAEKPAIAAAAFSGRRSIGDMARTSMTLSDPAFDLLLFPASYTYVPIVSRARQIVVIHDVIPETHPELLPRFRSRLFWRAKTWCAVTQADAIVAVSEFTRRGVLRHFGLHPDSVFVVGEAGDPVFRRIDNPRPTSRLIDLGFDPRLRSIVYVGGFDPHKNLPALIEVFAGLAASREFDGVTLYLVGDHSRNVFLSEFQSLRRLVMARRLEGRVVFTGFLPDEDLAVLLNLATVLILPSLLEGFGLPAIEAAACGCPVVATTASPIPEVLGEGGIYIDPANRRSIEAALVRVLRSESLRERMSAAGQDAAGRLTWDRAATQMLQVIHKLLHQ